MFDHRSGQVLQIDGAIIYVEEIGDPTRFPLVLLHGGIGTMDDFSPVLATLARSFRVIGIDSRGHGRSTLGAEPLTYARLQRDVRNAADVP